MEIQAKSYIIVLANSPDDLATKVNDWIDHGYYPVGGPTVFDSPKGQMLLQALVLPGSTH